jgi:metallo-beta-lactamase class B
MMETALEFDAPVWGRPPKRDIAVKDGDALTLGDTTITFYVTPGHTLGTLSPVFDVCAGGRSHKALLWGGTAFNFGRDLGRLESYIASSERMRKLTAQLPVEVLLSNHPGWDATVAKIAALRARGGGAHPFVTGRDVVDRSLRVLGECARAQRGRFLIS